MGKHKLVDLANVLESLSLIPAEVAQAVVPEINAAILAMGKPGGPLRGGNRVKCRVEASGNKIKIVGVFSSAGVRRSWVAIVEKIVAEAIRKRMTG